jgi:hypothetical protein
MTPAFDRDVYEYTAVITSSECMLRVDFLTLYEAALASASRPDATCAVGNHSTYIGHKFVKCSRISSVAGDRVNQRKHKIKCAQGER